MLKTFQGSCHCGQVRFEADIDLNQGTVRCNCSICLKGRFWSALVKPEAFRLLCGADALTCYQFHTKTEEHFFCKYCGLRSFGTGKSPRWGRFYGVSVTCLDDVTERDLADAPVTFIDGRHDEWDRVPAETRHL